MEQDTQPLQFLICATKCSIITDRGLHIPKLNQEWWGKHSLTKKNDKKKQTLFTSEATFFGLCPRTDRDSLTHSSVLPCVHQRFTGASQQIQKHLWSLDVLSVSYGSSVTLPAQLPTDPSQIRSTQLSLLSPSDSCILFSFKLAF